MNQSGEASQWNLSQQRQGCQRDHRGSNANLKAAKLFQAILASISDKSRNSEERFLLVKFDSSEIDNASVTPRAGIAITGLDTICLVIRKSH